MKFKVEVNGEPKEVEIKMLGKHTKRVWKSFEQLSADKETDEITSVSKHMERIWTLICELTGLAESDQDEMLEDDIKKLVDYVQSKAKNRMDFTNAS